MEDANAYYGIAGAIRQLTIDAIEKANSGHPGLPLGCAEIGSYLYGHVLNHYPRDPEWLNRDRFVLSAGHGSMLLYSCLHLAGFDLSIEEIKNFRQLDSKTPGHPEYGVAPGVEATTGPLGQGIGNATGMALAMKILKTKFNRPDFSIFSNKIYCLASDGCMMEGGGSEAASLAGHWKLDNLVVIYDNNNITLDGRLDESYSDNTKKRFEAYGWDVFEMDGHNIKEIEKTFRLIEENQTKPVFIIAHTQIGKGSPHKAGTHKVHGSPLGKEESIETKRALGLSEKPFYIEPRVYEFFKKRLEKQKTEYEKWLSLFKQWQKKYPDLAEEFAKMQTKELPENLGKQLEDLSIKTPIAGRGASHQVMQLLAKDLPFLYGGSADLSSSDQAKLDAYATISSSDFEGRNIKYGVREFAMATISNGLALSQMILPFCGTFLVFSDYMRNPMRLAALSSLQVVYQLTHDSVFLGEDGPTHQPIEQLAALRAMPNMQVIRPADGNEVKMAWIAAFRHIGPTALILSRQALAEHLETKKSYEEGMKKGAYIVKKEKNNADVILMATGSELSLALETAKELEAKGKDVRVISFPCWFLFEKQSDTYKQDLLFSQKGKKIAIEAASSFGWHRYVGDNGDVVCVDRFGMSAPMDRIKKALGFTVEKIVDKIC